MNTAAVTRQILLLAGLAIIAVAAMIWSGRDGEEPAGEFSAGADSLAVTVVAHSPTDTVMYVHVRVAAPISALGALEQAAGREQIAIGLREYDFGRLVVSIGDLVAGGDAHWTYRINGELMPVAAGACLLADGDTLEFRFGDAPPDSL